MPFLRRIQTSPVRMFKVFSYFNFRFVIGDYMDIAVTPPIVEDRGYYGRGRGGYNRGGPRGGGGDRRFRPY